MGIDVPTLNQRLLTPEQRDKLESYHQAKKQLTVLEDIADMTQELIGTFDSQAKTSEKVVDDMGALLMDIRESLNTLRDKKDPDAPDSTDYTKPIVEAVAKLESAIKAIDIKPVVDAPQVNIAPPNVDLKGVEKAIAGIPKAFEAAIKLIPAVEIPETDNQPLLEAWEGISEQLVSIENATRMKPLPGSMAVSNIDDVATQIEINNPKYAAFQFDPNDDAPDYIGKNTDPDATDEDVNWVIYKFTYSGADVTAIKKKIGSWTDRVSLF